MSRNFRVGIVGATGIAGQQFVVALQRHPWFTITRLAASERSAGKPFGQALLDPKTGARRWWCAEEPAPSVLATARARKPRSRSTLVDAPSSPAMNARRR